LNCLRSIMFSVVLLLAAGSVVQQSEATSQGFPLPRAVSAAEALAVPPTRVRGGVPRMRDIAPSMDRRAAIASAVLFASAPALAEDTKDKGAAAEAPAPPAQEKDKAATAEAPAPPAQETTTKAPAKAAKSASSKPIPFRYVTGKDFKAKRPEGLFALPKDQVKKQQDAMKQGKMVVPTTDANGKPFITGEEASAIIKNSGARTFNDLAEGVQSGGGWQDHMIAVRRNTERLVAERAARKQAQR